MKIVILRALYIAMILLRFLGTYTFVFVSHATVLKKVVLIRIIQTIPLPGHALPNPLIRKPPLVAAVLILPSLMEVKNQSAIVWHFLKRFVQHLRNLFKICPFTDCATDDFSIIQIQNRRQIQLPAKRRKLCDIGCPFLIRFSAWKSLFSRLGAVFPTSPR